jgi:hypothetical protein
MIMDDYQRGEAVDLLITITDVDPDEIEEYEDHALEAWLGELGFEWNPDTGVAGAWVPMREPPPVFGSIQRPNEPEDLGPLFDGA